MLYKVETMPTVTSETYLTIKEAAEFLGVNPMTLRRWDATGKLKARRHPMNHYRLYRRAELEQVLQVVAYPQQRS